MSPYRKHMAAFIAVLVGAGTACANEFDPALVARAKQEGSVTFYTVGQLYKQLAASFERKFGIRVNTVRGDSQEIILKLTNESRGGRGTADVLTLGGSGTETLKAANILKPFKLASSAGINEKYRDPAGYWAATVIYIQLPGLNTNLVPEAERPTSFDDFLHPRWKGRLVWKPNDVTGAVGLIGNVLTSMGEDKGMAYLSKLAQQNVRVVNVSTFALANQVAAGEYPIALQIMTNQIELGQRRGGPIAWVATKPVSATFETVSLPAKSPRPNAGELFAEYLLSKEGQALYSQALYVPVRTDIEILTKARPDLGALDLNILTPELFQNGQDRWIQVFNQIFRK
jgi:ABC-type Fe3+ transport system substrate-binding protein